MVKKILLEATIKEGSDGLLTVIVDTGFGQPELRVHASKAISPLVDGVIAAGKMTKRDAFREIYFEATHPRTSVASVKRLIRALRVFGVEKAEALSWVLELGDFSSNWLRERLKAAGMIP